MLPDQKSHVIPTISRMDTKLDMLIRSDGSTGIVSDFKGSDS
jgi:hypothetical protein